jgi:hypothetical protein
MEFRRRDKLYSDTIDPQRPQARAIDHSFDGLHCPQGNPRAQQEQQKLSKSRLVTYKASGFDIAWTDLLQMAVIFLIIGSLLWVHKVALL